MIRIVASPAAGSTDAIASVVEQAIDGGAPPPPWVAIEDDAGDWIGLTAAASPGERAGAVLAARTDAALVQAVRLGIGGAFWLPPSTVDAGVAFRAAAENLRDVTPALDPWAADLVSGPDQPVAAVTWINRAFWRCQLGERRMASLLAEMAAELGVLSAVLPWPAVLMPLVDVDDITRAWQAVTRRTRVASEGLSVVVCGPRQGHCGVASAALEALVGAPGDEVRTAAAEFPRAVCELPSGRPVGRWAPVEIPCDHGGVGWSAIPEAATAHGFRWRLTGVGEVDRWVEDGLGPQTEAAVGLRVPGWFAAEAGLGRPAGCVLERLAAGAERRGVPLWVPNVDQARLQFLLRLPGTFWVDGSAVPERGTKSKT